MYGGCSTMEVWLYAMCAHKIFTMKFNFTGLALIIAHIFKSCDVWKKCKFRIFGVTDQLINVDTEKNK